MANKNPNTTTTNKKIDSSTDAECLNKEPITNNKKVSFFTKLYNKTLALASHKDATKILFVYSFLESIILPIPTDVLLAPIAMQKPNKALSLAFYVTVFSIIGGIIGFYLGFYFKDFGHSFIVWLSSENTFNSITTLLENYGYFAVLLVGFTPLPFKVFTITFGMFGVPFYTFVFYSFISRLTRFLIVSYLFATFGNRYRNEIEKFINRSGWFILILCIVIFLIYYFYKVYINV